MEIRDRRNGFYWGKDRMKWFSTSHDGRHNGGPIGARTVQDIARVTLDGQLKDLNQGRNHMHRGDKTTILSNYYPMGWYKTTDHNFSVAKYGNQYSSMSAADIDVRRQRGTVNLDHSKMVEYRDGVTSKALVATMKRIATERSASLPAHFQLSLEEKVRIVKQGKRPAAAKPHDDAHIDHDVVEAMVSATRKNKHQKIAV